MIKNIMISLSIIPGLWMPCYAAEIPDENFPAIVPTSSLVELVGTIVYLEIEGGGYGIIADDGRKYIAIDLPVVFQQPELRVRLLALEAPNLMGFQQWGRYLYLVDIVPSACPPPDLSNKSLK